MDSGMIDIKKSLELDAALAERTKEPIVPANELEAAIKDPIKFFTILQNRYVFKNPELSNLCREIADEHRRIEREDARFREFVINMGEAKRKNIEEDGKSRVSLWH